MYQDMDLWPPFLSIYEFTKALSIMEITQCLKAFGLAHE